MRALAPAAGASAAELLQQLPLQQLPSQQHPMQKHPELAEAVLACLPDVRDVLAAELACRDLAQARAPLSAAPVVLQLAEAQQLRWLLHNVDRLSELALCGEAGDVRSRAAAAAAPAALAALAHSAGALRALFLRRCNGLAGLRSWSAGPEALRTLQVLELSHCPALRALHGLPGLPGLKSLSVKSCRRLESLPEALPPALTCISLDDCPRLERLPASLPHLTDLRTLHVARCGSLHTLPPNLGLSPALSELRVYICMRLTWLPGQLPASLVKLDLLYCPLVVGLVDSLHGLHSLRELSVRGCPEVGELTSRLRKSMPALELVSIKP